jgi:hypothetical protein
VIRDGVRDNGRVLSRADDESFEASGDSVCRSCALLGPRRRSSPAPGPRRRPSAAPSRPAHDAGPHRRRPTAHRAAACPSRRSASPAAAAGSCPTSVGLARVAPAAALLEPSGERETNRTIGREELREEIKGRRRERKREKNKGKKEKKERIR